MFTKYRINNNENLNPFFIIGSGRSGNTLLRRILVSGDEVFIPPETYILGELFYKFKKYNNMPWDDLVKFIYAQFEYHPEFYTFELDSLNKLVKKMEIIEENKRTLANLLNEFYYFYAKKHNIKGKQWGDKTPYNTFYLFEIKKIFPNAKCIHIIRNGLDVVYSYVNAGLYKNYDKATIRWIDSIKLAKKFGKKYPESYLEIYYEELVKSPEKVIKEVCNFLNLTFDKKMIYENKVAKNLGDTAKLEHHKNIFNPITTNSIGKGVKNINIEKLKYKQKLLKTLYLLGYKI